MKFFLTYPVSSPRNEPGTSLMRRTITAYSTAMLDREMSPLIGPPVASRFVINVRVTTHKTPNRYILF
jgi:hypothetical protein